MNVEELLARAWAAVEKAGIPEPLHEYAFKEALTRLDETTPDKARPTSREQVSPDPAKARPTSKNRDTSADLSEPFAKFAHESGVSVQDLERVFFFNDGLPHLNGPRAKLGGTAAEQAKTVAIALTAAYDYALDESSVSDDVVRAETVRLKIDTARNWSRMMTSLQGVNWVGQARRKQFKTTNATADSLRKIVTNILGAPSE